jgi:16S rRNA (uracil1498-N3)-methyltransferase
MHRFYVEKVDRSRLVISDAGQLHHLKDVLRLKVGDEVKVFDAGGKEYRCLVKALERAEGVLTVEAQEVVPQSQCSLTVGCAIPKKAGMDDIVDNLTQLGVTAIIPLETERVIVKLDAIKKEERLQRWKRIAQSAAEQSQRSILPLVHPVSSFAEVIAASADYNLKLIPALTDERKTLRDVLEESGLVGARHAVPTVGKIIVLIGPEGDFTSEEVQIATAAGFIPVSLGNTTLRVATAAIVTAGYIKLSLAG